MRRRFISTYLLVFLILAALYGAYAQSDKAQKQYMAAKEYFDEGNVAKAHELLNKCIAEAPKYKDAYWLRSVIHQMLDDEEAAITDLSILIALDPEFIEAYYSRGVMRYQTNKYDLAREDFFVMLNNASKPTNVVYFKVPQGQEGATGAGTMSTMHSEIYNYIGLTYTKSENYDSAIYYFDKAIQGNDLEPNYYINRGLAYQGMEKWVSARQDFENALKVDEENPVAGFNLANLNARLGDTASQIALLNKSIDSNPDFHEGYVQRAAEYYKRGEYDLSAQDLEKAISLKNDKSEYWNDLGMTQIKLQKFEQAVASLGKALELEANNERAYFNRGNAWFNLQNFENAEKDYQLAIFYNEAYANAYLNLGVVRLRLGKTNEACESLKIADDLGVNSAKKILALKCQ